MLNFFWHFLFSLEHFEIFRPAYFKFNDFAISSIIAYLRPLKVLINLSFVISLWTFKSVHLWAPSQSCLLVERRSKICHNLVIMNLVISFHCWESDAESLVVSTNHLESNVWITLHIFQTIDVVFFLVIDYVINEVIKWIYTFMIFTIENITHDFRVFINTFA